MRVWEGSLFPLVETCWGFQHQRSLAKIRPLIKDPGEVSKTTVLQCKTPSSGPERCCCTGVPTASYVLDGGNNCSQKPPARRLDPPPPEGVPGVPSIGEEKISVLCAKKKNTGVEARLKSFLGLFCLKQRPCRDPVPA